MQTVTHEQSERMQRDVVAKLESKVGTLDRGGLFSTISNLIKLHEDAYSAERWAKNDDGHSWKRVEPALPVSYS